MPHAAPEERKGYWARFIEAVKQTFRYVIFGGVVGLILIFVATYAKPLIESIFTPKASEVMEKLLEHVGMGFIVAAIAVLFYEWGAHLKDSLQLSQELNSLRQAVAAEALNEALDVQLQTNDEHHNAEVTEAISTIVAALKQLQDHGDWAQMGFQRFIAAMITRVKENAQQLAALSSERTAAARNITVLTPAVLVDNILAEQIRRLPKDGRYSVVTNPGDWKEGQFPTLQEQSKIAVESRGVVVRRILVLADDGPNSHQADAGEVERILNLHAAAAQQVKPGAQGGGLTFKVLDESERQRLKKIKLNAATEILNHHFAIIDFPGAPHCLKIEAEEPGLSDFELKAIPRSAREIEWFDRVWDKLPQLDRAQLDAILARWKAAH
jgi:hypothetical protein